MTQQRLNSLSLMNIEYEILDSIDFGELIEDFAELKPAKFRSKFIVKVKTSTIKVNFLIIAFCMKKGA